MHRRDELERGPLAQRAARLAAMVGTKPTRSLSVIVPAYNEELRIGKMLEPTFAYLEQRARADVEAGGHAAHP